MPTFLIGVTLALVLWWALHAFPQALRLRHIPGPLLPSLSDLFRASWVLGGRAHEVHIRLHERYGRLVRFGPRMVSVADPCAIPTVYPMRSGFEKSDFYKVLLPYTNGRPMASLFGTADGTMHRSLRSPIAQFFSMSAVISLEPQLDEAVRILFEELDTRFADGKTMFDFGLWIQMFAFDAMGILTFSEPYGFLKNGQDIRNMMKNVWLHFRKTAVMTQVPWLHQILLKYSFLAPFAPQTTLPILKLTGEKIKERQKKDNEKHDMLSKFIAASKKHADTVPWALTVWTFSNVTAGSDTVAVGMRAGLHGIFRDPITLLRLKEELMSVHHSIGDDRTIPWKEISDLPFLDACVKESIRLNPAFGLPLERVVPPGGAVICGQFLPEGTVVGMSPWLVNRHKPTFGDDADIWNPSRWLCEDNRRQFMEKSLLSFGAGRRTCLGRNIAIFETKKLIAAFVRRYNIDLVEPEGFTVENRWLVNQSGLYARLSLRNSSQNGKDTVPSKVV